MEKQSNSSLHVTDTVSPRPRAPPSAHNLRSTGTRCAYPRTAESRAASERRPRACALMKAVPSNQDTLISCPYPVWCRPVFKLNWVGGKTVIVVWLKIYYSNRQWDLLLLLLFCFFFVIVCCLAVPHPCIAYLCILPPILVPIWGKKTGLHGVF